MYSSALVHVRNPKCDNSAAGSDEGPNIDTRYASYWKRLCFIKLYLFPCLAGGFNSISSEFRYAKYKPKSFLWRHVIRIWMPDH